MQTGRSDFGASCGIQDTSDQSASGFVMSGNGQWTALEAGSGPAGSSAAVAADFPDVWEVRKLEQLPFSPLLKR